MQLKIQTEKFKEMVRKAVKGAGNRKTIPITSLIAVELKEHVLTLTTTDGNNYLYVTEKDVEGDDFYAVVPVEVFSKLIAKTTCDVITLSLTGKMNVLKVKGNGNYSIELPSENGEPVRYPDPIAKLKGKAKEKTKIELSTIRIILNSIKPVLAVTLEYPYYTGYYMGEKVVGTDCSRLAIMDTKISDEAVLISPETMNLLSIMTDEKIDYSIYDSVVVFKSSNCTLYAMKMEGLEEFKYEDIVKASEQSFSSMCKLSKLSLLQVLDRLALFVSPYDKNKVHFTFTEKGLQISSEAKSGVELIPFLESENFASCECSVDITMFLAQVKAQTLDVVEMHYGAETALKMVDGNVVQLIALAVESEKTEEEE